MNLEAYNNGLPDFNFLKNNECICIHLKYTGLNVKLENLFCSFSFVMKHLGLYKWVSSLPLNDLLKPIFTSTHQNFWLVNTFVLELNVQFFHLIYFSYEEVWTIYICNKKWTTHKPDHLYLAEQYMGWVLWGGLVECKQFLILFTCIIYIKIKIKTWPF